MAIMYCIQGMGGVMTGTWHLPETAFETMANAMNIPAYSANENMRISRVFYQCRSHPSVAKSVQPGLKP
jgi:hypothetical protein